MSEFDFEIKSGERLPAETRMEVPELSYEQELLLTHVPFKNRVEFLSDYVKPHARHMTVDEIARRLNVSVGRVETLADRVGANFTHNDSEGTTFELFTFEVIEEEIVWQKVEDSLEDQISAYAIAEYLAKSEVWVRRTAYNLAVYPEQRWENNRWVFLYPKEVLLMLRTVILHTPPANDFYAIDEAVALVGKSREWIARAVELNELDWEVRLLSVSHKDAVHYPKETIDVLCALAAELPPPAGNWLTVTQMGVAVSRTKEWVRAHLGEQLYAAEPRIGDNMKVEGHFPPETLQYLKGIIAELPPYADDWVTVWGIATKLGRSVPWVQNHISEYDDCAELRLTNRGNRPLMHYPPEVLAALALIS